MRNNTYLREMGEKIKTIRMSKGISQSAFAKLCNMHAGAVCEIECGKKNSMILTLKTMADVLGVDVKEFL